MGGADVGSRATDPLDVPSTATREVELKFPVASVEVLRQRLVDLGADGDGEVFEDNVLLDLPDGSLRRRGEVLRLRRDRHVRLTHKAPVAGDAPDGQPFKERFEREVRVDDFDAALDILRALGYQPSTRYQKFRETFALGVEPAAGTRESVAVTIDRLPFGTFCEIEGSRPAIVAAASRLGLSLVEATPEDYLALHARLARERATTAGLVFDRPSSVGSS